MPLAVARALKSSPSATAGAKPPNINQLGALAQAMERGSVLLYTGPSRIFCVLQQITCKTRARADAPHCGFHCRPRTAASPLLIALSHRTVLFNTPYAVAGRTVHGAGANATDRPRVALNVAYNSAYLKQEVR